MIKAGIITLFHNSLNYGGILQAFALQEMLTDNDVNVYEIDYTPTTKNKSQKTFLNMLKFKSLKQIAKKTINYFIKKIYGCLFSKHFSELYKQRQKAFDGFKKQAFNNTIKCNQFDIEEKCSFLDVLVCGSDQIWKPTVVDDAYMLNFCMKSSKRRFSYAASMSVDNIDDKSKIKFENWLKNLDAISVREKRAVELLQPLTNNKVHLVCDPVFLLTKKQWAAYFKKELHKKNYIFCYFLGHDIKHRKIAKNYAQKNNLDIVTFPNLVGIPDYCDSNFGTQKIYDANPIDFVQLINGAAYVLTDSFHATAFSIIMNTNFAVFERNAIFSMNSRLISLLDNIDCNNRFIKNYEDLINLENICNWDIINKQIYTERSKCLKYIETQLRF